MSKARAALVAGLVAAAVFLLLWRTAPAPNVLRTGSTAPGFLLAELDGRSARALADDRGKIVLVNFWATWCKPCLDEMPAMQRLYDALPREDFEMLAISVDDPGSEEAVREFRDRLELGFPILLDPGRDAAASYQTFRFPESFLVGRDGRIAARYIGPKEWDSALYVKHLQDLVALPAAP